MFFYINKNILEKNKMVMEVTPVREGEVLSNRESSREIN